MAKLKLSILIILLIFSSSNVLHSQVLNQDASGGTTIMYHGSTINFDAANSNISFVYNNFRNELPNSASKQGFLGIRMRATAKNGIANVINTTNITPDGEIGISFGKVYIKEENLGKTLSLISERQKQIFLSEEQIQIKLEEKLKNSVNISKNQAIEKKIKELINQFGIYELYNELSKFRLQNESFFKDNAAANTEFENFLFLIKELVISKNNSALSEKEIKQLYDRIERSYWQKRHLIYGNINLTGSQFMFEKDANNIDLTKRFKKQNFTGYKAGIGYNYQKGGEIIYGLGLGYELTNTFSLLDDAEITLIDTKVNSTQKIESKKSFTAYSGNYNTFNRIFISGDIIKFFSGLDSDKSVIVGNLFFRHLESNNKSVFPTITNVGAGAYFFKNNGVFLGGVFIESQDIFDNLWKKGFIPDEKLLFKRFVVGLTTKFSIGTSIIQYRPIN